MNFQSEDRNGTHSEFSRLSKFLCKRRSGSHVNQSNKCLRREENSQEVFKNCFYEEDFMFNGVYKRNKLAEPTRQQSNSISEPQNMVSQSILCSKYSNNETSRYPLHENSTTEVKFGRHETSVKRKDNMGAKVTFGDGSEREIDEDLNKRCHGKLSSDKTTYCRPVANLYNEEFLYKTIEKNARLQRLVKKMVIARQKEKETENWKNYIDGLKRKHFTDTKIKRPYSLQHVYEDFVEPDTVDHYYNAKCKCRQSDPCQYLLQDLYNELDTKPSYCENRIIPNMYGGIPQKHNPFETNSMCYPISSQGRLIMLERERMNRLQNRGNKLLPDKIIEDSKSSNNYRVGNITKLTNSKKNSSGKSFVFVNNRGTNTTLQGSSTQTEFHPFPFEHKEMTMKNNTRQAVFRKINAEVQHNAEITIESTVNSLKKNSLACIEEKLDSLIHSINTFIVEIKTKRCLPNKYFDQPTRLGKGNVCYTRSDSFNMARKEKIVCGFLGSSSRSTRNSSEDNFHKIQTIDDNLTKINDILFKGIGKNKVTLSVGETYHPCSVQISVTIPTKEISTEVTRSLSRAGRACDSGHNNVIIEELPRREDDRMAIAVNTDPVSLLAMLRVSTEETIRRMLSYVPSIDYYSYLSRLGPLPRAVESNFVCNLCGAAFPKPSALTDHIQKHELGKTRDCCVCRHVLDQPRRRPGLFKCQFCGQRFTRAYCCELHQDSCARRLGKRHEVPSSLILLR